MDKQFIGEHLLPGEVGHLFVIASFVAVLFSFISYFQSVLKERDAIESNRWTNLGRWAFFAHFCSVLGIFGSLYYLIANHLFEYHYSWEHSSLDMPGKYLLSCFWEGQQGSFMLWTFWQALLGLIVMRTSKTLESRTMATIALVQVLLGTMLLGFYFGPDVKIGLTPFDLLRNSMQGAPIFSRPDYLQFIMDGNGLNVLLQNYWMVIHPPILFLGFATTIVPFAYCIAALWKKDYQSFVKPVVAWCLFNGAVLGTGIMMGGAWAYESLNFGGYWAWDPVENSSLVPWITLIAGLHTLILYKSTGRALKFTFVLLLLSHLLVWYSTFLTRTGILGNTSVHAFTGDGSAMFYHLVVVVCLLLLIATVLLVVRWRGLDTKKGEEETFTREFWLFIGSSVLFISAIHIVVVTSIPVWSPVAKFFTGKDFSLLDPISHYNNVEVWIAVLTGVFAGSALYMKFRHTDVRVLAKQLLVPALVSLVLAIVIAIGQKINKFQYDLMLFSACYGMVASLSYAISIQKGRLRKMGPSIAHFGFAMVLMGILLSSFNKHVISNNTGELFRFSKKTEEESLKESMENVILFRHKPVKLGEYTAVYTGDSAVEGKDKRVYYKVDFTRVDSATGKTTEQFTLYPDAFINPKGMQGLSANPSTKHYLDRDVFTFINAVQNAKEEQGDIKKGVVKNSGDTVVFDGGYLLFTGFGRLAKDDKLHPGDSDMGVTAMFDVFNDSSRKIGVLRPVYLLRDKKYVVYSPDTLKDPDIIVQFDLHVTDKEIPSADVQVTQLNDMENYIVLKAIVFPYINVLWLGVILMVFGFFVSLFHRLTTS